MDFTQLNQAYLFSLLEQQSVTVVLTSDGLCKCGTFVDSTGVIVCLLLGKSGPSNKNSHTEFGGKKATT